MTGTVRVDGPSPNLIPFFVEVSRMTEDHIVQDNLEVYGDDVANEPDDEERNRRYYGEDGD